MNRLLIDGDIIVYKLASQKEVPIKWDDDLWTLHCSEDEVCGAFDDYIEQLRKDTQTKEVVVCLSHSNNFRKEILTTYKGNRVDKRKPVCMGAVRQYVMKNYDTRILPNLEADDVIGILATSEGGIVVSEDKDLLQIAGTHWDAATKDFYTVKTEEGEVWFYMQTLMGDTTDNYSGCPGVGPVKAAKVIQKGQQEGSVWGAILEAFKTAGLTEEDALQQARVARILRASDWDGSMPILWKP